MKKKKIWGILRKMAAMSMVGLLTFSSACSNKENEVEKSSGVEKDIEVEKSSEARTVANSSNNVNSELMDSIVDKGDFTYVAKYFNHDPFDMNDTMQLFEDKVCILENKYDSKRQKNSQKINIYSLDNGEMNLVNTLAESKENEVFEKCVINKDHSLLLLKSKYNTDVEKDPLHPGYFLNLLSEDGKEIFDIDISDMMDKMKSEYGLYINSVSTDAEGNIYILCENNLLLLDKEGKELGIITSNEWFDSIICGPEGKAFVTLYDDMNESHFLYEVDVKTKSLGKRYSGIKGGYVTSTGDDKIFCSDGSSLYIYNIKEERSEKLLTWTDVNVNGNDVQGFVPLNEDFILNTYDYTAGLQSMIHLEKTSKSLVQEKNIITIGTLYPSDIIQDAVVNFNKNNDAYTIKVHEYIDFSSITEDNYNDAYNDGVTRLNNDIIGNNCPDLIYLEDLEVAKYADKGVFEDLNPYLDRSTVLDRNDIMENVLEACTYNGKLVTIPERFIITTLAGKASDLGDARGWNIDELMAYSEAHPESRLFHIPVKSIAMNYIIKFNIGNFVDWENNTCNFDSDQFKKILNFVKKFPDDFEFDTDTLAEQIGNGKVLLVETFITDLEDVQYTNAIFGNEKINFIGYPNENKDIGCLMDVRNSIAISSKSTNKEAAWKFMESILTADNGEKKLDSFGFSTRKSIFEKSTKIKASNDYTADENGNAVADSGDDVTFSVDDGWSYSYHTSTQEEIDVLKSLISVAKVASSVMDPQIEKIIQDEAEAFYKGSKSVDDVTKIIQSRVSIYMSENQ